LTCLDNLLLAKPQEGEKFWTALFCRQFIKEEEKLNTKWAEEFLELVGLLEKRQTLAENLSYGQQKLLEIARALAAEADFLLLDEPMAGVHQDLRQKLIDVIVRVKKKGKTVLFIEHNTDIIEGLAEKVIQL
jgi:ABC-type branched-subunit amino acid transport system ATPase component